jgi:hypothetical protein
VEVNLPELSENSDDTQVHHSLMELEEAHVAIKTQRQTMKQVVAQQINFDAEDSESITITESTAEESSYAVRRDMALIAHIGFTREPAQLVGFTN